MNDALFSFGQRFIEVQVKKCIDGQRLRGAQTVATLALEREAAALKELAQLQGQLARSQAEACAWEALAVSAVRDGRTTGQLCKDGGEKILAGDRARVFYTAFTEKARSLGIQDPDAALCELDLTFVIDRARASQEP